MQIQVHLFSPDLLHLLCSLKFNRQVHKCKGISCELSCWFLLSRFQLWRNILEKKKTTTQMQQRKKEGENIYLMWCGGSMIITMIKVYCCVSGTWTWKKNPKWKSCPVLCTCMDHVTNECTTRCIKNIIPIPLPCYCEC